MSLDPELLELFPHSVTLAAPSSVSNAGEVAWGAGTSYQARVAKRQDIVRDKNGYEQVSETLVDLTTAPGAKPSWKITLPDGATPPILAVSVAVDEDGDCYETIYCGKSQTGK